MTRSYSLSPRDQIRFTLHETRMAHDLTLLLHSFAIPGPITQTAYDGTAGDDDYVGTADDDVFEMSQGGVDTVNAKGGNDVIFMGDSMTADDRIDGGNDGGNIFVQFRDWLYLDGDYSAGLVFGAHTMTRVENVFLAPGNSYELTIHENTVPADGLLAIHGNNLTAGDDLTVDVTADTDATTLIYGGPGLDRLTSGAGNTQFTFYAGTLAVTDRVNGGEGIDALQLIGDYSGGFVFSAKTIKNIDNLYPTSGDDYVLTMNDGNLAAGDTLTVVGGYLGDMDRLVFDGSAETDGFFNLFGGPGHDELIGGKQADHFTGALGGDQITPGKGLDRVIYDSAAESGGQRYDIINGFDFGGVDRFVMDFVPAAIDSKIKNGSLSALTFDADMVAAVSAAKLAANHAVLFKPSAGTLAGMTFLVVDANGAAGFQSGDVDLVVRLDNAAHLLSLGTEDFNLI